MGAKKCHLSARALIDTVEHRCKHNKQRTETVYRTDRENTNKIHLKKKIERIIVLNFAWIDLERATPDWCVGSRWTGESEDTAVAGIGA